MRRLLNMLILIAVATNLGCSDQADDLEARAKESEKRITLVYDQAKSSICSAMKSRGIKLGFDKKTGTTTTYQIDAYDYDEGLLKDEEQCGFFEEYDFTVPACSGIKSHYSFSIWKCYADALSEIANALSSECESNQLTGEGGDSSAGKEDIRCRSFKEVSRPLIVERIISWEGGATYAVAMVVQLGTKDCRCAEKGASPVKAWAQEACNRSLSGPVTYEDGEGVAWAVGIVPVDEIVDQSDKKMSDQLAYSFAATMCGAKVSSTKAIENKVVEDGEEKMVLQEYRKTTHIKPAETIDPNDESRVKWFTFVADHPKFGITDYRVCAIRD